jgi:hypothetical protein
MKFFRNRRVLKSMTLITGFMVLNMSLFLAEVEALKLLQDRQMTENIAKLIMGAANEEEKDIAGSGEEEMNNLKGASVLLSDFTIIAPYLLALRIYPCHLKSGEATSPFLETVIPPPKFSHIS